MLHWPTTRVQRNLVPTWNPARAGQVKDQLRQELAPQLDTLARNWFYYTHWMRTWLPFQNSIESYIGGRLDQWIARYGPENVDLIRLQIRKEAGELNEQRTAVLDLFDEVRQGLPDSMRTEGNVKNLKLAFMKAQFGHGLDLEAVDVDEMGQRWQILQGQLRLTEERVQEDWADIQETFGVRGDLALIHLTGSDFHNQGQSVSIAESDEGDKVVYKPRSLLPDRALMAETGSVFAELNERGKGAGISLPTAKFDQKRDDQGQYGYMEHFTQARVLSEKAAQAYYYRMGQVAVASKLLGVNDLHQENVLTAYGAPVVIDAETSFLPYVMLADSFDSTGLSSALRAFTKHDELTPNTFLTENELAAAQEQGVEPWSQAYVEARRRAVLKGESGLSTYLERGVVQMLKFVNQYQGLLTRYLLDKSRTVRNVRLVPFDTLFFFGYINGFHDIRSDPDLDPETRAERIGTLLDAAVEKTRESLTGKGFVLVENFDELVREGYRQDFQSRDVPVFHYQPAQERVTFHGGRVATIAEDRGLETAIPTVVQRILGMSVQDVLQSF